jgi:3-isopropylmalate/(R)-2-methylmalate dehydratase small subunit
MSNTFSGKIWKLREDVDTDIIIPTQYVALETVEEMSKHAFEPLRPDLAGKIQPGDIIVAGKNFGCGSSREMAAEVLVALNIKCIIAESFARIFFRNAINNGIYLIENKDIYFNCNEGDNLKVIINDKIIWRVNKKYAEKKWNIIKE